MTARSTMASWKDSTVWYRQRRPRQGAIEHSKTSGPLSICLQENWTIAKSAYPLEVRKNQHLSQGIIAGGRNPLSHEEVNELKKSDLFSEKDCLDLLSLLSHLFKRLDNS